jgi:hypothetical protein
MWRKRENKETMSKDKKREGANKPRDAVYLRLKGELREKLEAEKARRGGDAAGVKLQSIIKEKLLRQLNCERKK